jgi:MFS family permease
MSGDLGAVLGPVVAGAVADASGYGATFALSALVCAAPVLVVLAAPETLRRSADPISAEVAAAEAGESTPLS